MAVKSFIGLAPEANVTKPFLLLSKKSRVLLANHNLRPCLTFTGKGKSDKTSCQMLRKQNLHRKKFYNNVPQNGDGKKVVNTIPQR